MPETQFERWQIRVNFALRQGTRVAWYTGHGLLLRQLARRAARQNSRPAPAQTNAKSEASRSRTTVPRLLADVAALLARDLANAEAGHYPMPQDDDGDFSELIAKSRAFFRDVPEVMRRRRGGLGHEVAAAGDTSARPDYYMQNFHFQSGGWMTENSARLYDMQVEVLFSGAANAMRRQALVPIAQELKGRDQRKIAFADIACGPGSFILQLRQAFPRLPALAIDLSEAYLREAKRQFDRRPKLQPVVAKAESLPLADASLDLATCVYLFHELPPEIRRDVAREIARVVKPGGLLVMVDSLQSGDEPDYDRMLAGFPESFHEPYFRSYLDDDLATLFADAGFTCESETNAFLSKVVSLRRDRQR